MTDIHNDELVEEDFDTILSPNIEFSGVIQFEKSFLVRGKIDGEISAAQGLLLIDNGALVNANIEADKVIIRGSVKGDVNAGHRVEITSTGRLNGNVKAPEINFETGCIFNGMCTMNREAKE